MRVKNTGCQSSLGIEVLNLYWAKAGINQVWSRSWDGSTMFLSPTGGGVVGKPIGSMTIPPIPAGEERILDFPWTVPNPNVYAGISPEMDANRWQFSLLARIEAPDSDPVTFPETSDLYSNVRLNRYPKTQIS